MSGPQKDVVDAHRIQKDKSFVAPVCDGAMPVIS
jgi:hypothetical protein